MKFSWSVHNSHAPNYHGISCTCKTVGSGTAGMALAVPLFPLFCFHGRNSMYIEPIYRVSFLIYQAYYYIKLSYMHPCEGCTSRAFSKIECVSPAMFTLLCAYIYIHGYTHV